MKQEGQGTHVSPMNDIDGLRALLLDIGMRPSDILFSDAILLVDGLSDEIFFNLLSHTIGAPLAERHVKVVAAGGYPRGRKKIEFWADVGQDAGLPLYLILDKDAAEEARTAIDAGQVPAEKCLILQEGAWRTSTPGTSCEVCWQTGSTRQLMSPYPWGRESRSLAGCFVATGQGTRGSQSSPRK